MEAEHTDRKRDSLMDRDYPVIIKVILIFFIVSSTINLLSQFFKNMILYNPSLAIYQLIGGGISLVAFILIYKKYIYGVYIFAFMMLLQVIINISSGPIFISAIIRLVILSLILFIPAKGVSVYNIMMYRKKHKSDTNNEGPEKEYWENYENVASISNLESESVNIKIGGEDDDEVIGDTTVEETIEADEGNEKDISLNEEEKHVEGAIEEEIEEEEIVLKKMQDKQEVDIDEPIKSKIKNGSKKISFIKRGLLALGILVVIVGGGLVIKITSRGYPHYVSSPIDKFKHYYSMPNNKLFRRLLNKGKDALSNDLDVIGRDYMNDAYDVKTNDITNIIELADYYNGKGSYLMANNMYEKGVNLDKMNPTLYYLIASNLFKLNSKDKEVVYNAQMALSIRPNYIEAVELLFNYYTSNRSVYEQRIWAQKYIDISPEDSKGYFYLAKALYDGGNKEEAKKVYNKAVQLDPANTLSKTYNYLEGPPFIVKNIQIANITKDGTIINDYRSNINANKARYLRLRANIEPLRIGEFTINLMVYANGSLERYVPSLHEYSFSHDFHIINKDTQVLTFKGWGYDTPGNWNAGVYKYELWFGKEKIAEESFTLY